MLQSMFLASQTTMLSSRTHALDHTGPRRHFHFGKANWEGMRAAVSQLFEKLREMYKSTSDVETLLTAFNNDLLSATNMHVPLGWDQLLKTPSTMAKSSREAATQEEETLVQASYKDPKLEQLQVPERELIIIIIIVICPLTARVGGAPQMILQPVSSQSPLKKKKKEEKRRREMNGRTFSQSPCKRGIRRHHHCFAQSPGHMM